MLKKCSTRQSCIFPKFTSFKIGTLDANFARAQMKNWNIHAISAIYIAQLILIVVQCCSKILVIMNEIRDSQCNSMHSFYARRSLNYNDFCYSRLIKQEGISYSPDPKKSSEFCFTNFLNFQSQGFCLFRYCTVFVFLSNISDCLEI